MKISVGPNLIKKITAQLNKCKRLHVTEVSVECYTTPCIYINASWVEDIYSEVYNRLSDFREYMGFLKDSKKVDNLCLGFSAEEGLCYVMIDVDNKPITIARKKITSDFLSMSLIEKYFFYIIEMSVILEQDVIINFNK